MGQMSMISSVNISWYRDMGCSVVGPGLSDQHAMMGVSAELELSVHLVL